MERTSIGPGSVPVLVVTGPVGVGKTTVVSALSERLGQLGAPHAAVDLDALRWCYPAPAHDPFHMALGLRNLAAVWSNYCAAGAERLVLADVVESRAAVAEYQAAVPGAVVQVVRLAAALPAILERLAGRESGDSLLWHQRRAAELLGIMEQNQVEDLLVHTDGKAPAEIAEEALARAGWLAADSASQFKECA